MTIETFREIEYSDKNLFETENGKLQLKRFADDLIFSVNFDNNLNAQFSFSKEQPIDISGSPQLGNFNYYGENKHLELSGGVVYSEENFRDLKSEGSIRFWLKSNFINE